MVEIKGIISNLGPQKNNKNGCRKAINPAFPRFVTQLHQNVQNCLQSHLDRLKGCNEGTNSQTSEKQRGFSTCSVFNVSLDKQLRAWQDNPVWSDEAPEIRVSVPKGSLCNLYAKVNVGLPPEAVYNIVTDPDNRRVFKNIKEVISRRVLVDEGSRQLVEVEQAALWRFLWWSGTISVHVLVDQNREDYSMKFKQIKTGFMKNFEGMWRVEPLFVDEQSCFPCIPKTLADYYTCTGGKGRIGSQVSLDQLIQPAIVPPPPISWYLRGITSKTTEMLITDLLAEAARIRGCADTTNSDETVGGSEDVNDEYQLAEKHDIKERWDMHRRNARRHRRKLTSTVKSAFG